MIYPFLDLLAVFKGPTSNGSDRGERRKGNGRGEREEGKERSWGGEERGRDLLDQCQTTSYMRL